MQLVLYVPHKNEGVKLCLDILHKKPKNLIFERLLKNSIQIPHVPCIEVFLKVIFFVGVIVLLTSIDVSQYRGDEKFKNTI